MIINKMALDVDLLLSTKFRLLKKREKPQIAFVYITASMFLHSFDGDKILDVDLVDMIADYTGIDCLLVADYLDVLIKENLLTKDRKYSTIFSNQILADLDKVKRNRERWLSNLRGGKSEKNESCNTNATEMHKICTKNATEKDNDSSDVAPDRASARYEHRTLNTEYINNNINKLNNDLNNSNLNLENQKNSKHFDLSSETQGRFRLKNYNYIYLSFPELQNLFDLFKTHKFTNAEIKQIFFQANVQLEINKHKISSKGGLAYKYLTGHILEDALKIKKESNLVQKTSTENLRRTPDFKQTKENLSRINDNNKSIDVNSILKKV